MPADQGTGIPHPPAPLTPTRTATPTLSSASPDTPSKKDTPHIIQTPKMKGYLGIGVGVGSRPGSTRPTTTPVKPDAGEMHEDNEGLGYGIELDQLDLREIGMDRGEGSSSSSTREIVLAEQPDRSVDTQRNTSPPPLPTVAAAGPDRAVELPDMDELQRMTNRVNATEGSADRDELATMLKSLLTPCVEQLPFLREQLEAQKATIQTMQEHARLATKLSEIERDRHAAERTGWHREMKALIRTQEAEIAAGKRPRKGLDLDVGYHQELEAANKRLEMDNRLMAPRLADTQKQIDKLVTELRHLRSNVILSTSIAQPSNAPLPAGEPNSHMIDERRRIPGSPSKATFNATTMGDARTEHLLLAARKVRSMRAENAHVGMLTLDELKRHGVVGPTGGVGYAEGYGGVQELSSEDELSEEEEDRKPAIGSSPRRPSVSKGKGKSQSVTNTPLLPRAKKSGKRTLPPVPTTPRGRNHQGTGPPPPTTTPGGSNFNDLLRAAELATRPHTPTRPGTEAHVPMSSMSATRTRMREESGSERGSPTKKARRIQPETSGATQSAGFPTEDTEEAERDPSALDLLAQASQLDVAQGDTPEADAGTGPAKPDSTPLASSTTKSSSSNTLEPAIDLHPSSTPRTEPPRPLEPVSSQPPQPLTTPQARPRNLSNASELQTPAQRLLYPMESPGPFDDSHQHQYPPATDPPPGSFASPTGATVPGLGKYVHLSSSMPARRVRSPYLKWTVEEDELLARAVAIHGEKWDLVSKGVPTRSYHQVRQRWLRKTGAFDKKQPGSTTPADHHGASALSGYDDDREGSPTPQSGRNKMRRDSK